MEHGCCLLFLTPFSADGPVGTISRSLPRPALYSQKAGMEVPQMDAPHTADKTGLPSLL